MSKVRCSYCGEIFDCDDSNQIIYCPKCFKELSLLSSKKNLGSYVAKHLSTALIELNEEKDYSSALKDFQIVLDVYPTDFDAAKGLVLSSLYCSTVRKSFIQESLDNLIRYKNALEINNVSFETIINFVKELNSSLDIYLSTLKKRLSKDDYFYEDNGLKLYLQSVKISILYKQQLIDLYFLNRKIPLSENINKSILEKQIKALKDELKIEYHIESNPLYLLNTNVKECYIEDTIFNDNKKLFKSKKTFLILFIIFFILFIVGIILIFVLPNRLAIGVPVASVGFLNSFIFLLIDILIVKKISQ